jgi:hypothetical protein
MMKSQYAQTTTVSVEKSQLEILSLLKRYGASQYGTGRTEKCNYVIFTVDNLVVRIEIPFVIPEDRLITHTESGKRRDDAVISKKPEQAEMQRWRVKKMLIQAKLEAIAIGDTTMVKEFMSDLLLPSGITLGDSLLSQIDNQWKSFGRVDLTRLRIVAPEGENGKQI